MNFDISAMDPFLKQVASHYMGLEGFQDLEFVFPNKRSSAFFRKYVCEEAARMKKAVIMPECKTINDLFASLSDLTPASRIPLLLKLYASYTKFYDKAESLDEFICWGDVLISDFNDIDKYLADPKQVFANVRDLKSIEDRFEYLTENQQEALKTFLHHFYEKGSDGKSSFAVNGEIKREFVRLWNVLFPLYEDFNAVLEAEGTGYEGQIYRKVARLESSVREHIEGRRFVFVGLNALNECEKKLLRHLRDSGAAEFCWDWSSEWIRDADNKASFFMAANVREFPQAFHPDPDGLPHCRFNVVCVPSAVGQAKQLPRILDNVRDSRAETCAIVLPDENMLLPVLNSIPENISHVNVTMGYPMKGSDFAVLLSSLSSARMNSLRKGEQTLFYHKFVRTVFSNTVFRKIATDRDMEVCAKIIDGRKVYIPAEDFSGSELLALYFSPFHADLSSASAQAVNEFAEYQKAVTEKTGELLADLNGSGKAGDMDTVFAKACYNAIVSLQQLNLEVRLATYLKLLDRVLMPVSVPFNGEPLSGLQIMGPLEARALDFKTLVILSCNEGVFPRKSFSSSFIPPELRKGFGLPTYEYQDAVWAYYFYRMIQRAENVWLMYDSRTDGVKSGEESRYIKQLEYLFNADIRYYVTSVSTGSRYEEVPLIKTEEHVEFLKNSLEYSATLLENYLDCPARLYYGKIEKLSDVRESADDLDGGMFGTAFHNVMQWLYSRDGDMSTPLGRVSENYIKERLSDRFRPELRARINREICGQLKTDQVRGQNLVSAGVIESYVEETLKYDLELLRKSGSFTVSGIELNLPFEFAGRRFIGKIDRLDSFGDGKIRVVDYKTGRVSPDELMVMGKDGDNPGAAIKIFDRIFKPEQSTRPKIALQFFVYNLMLLLNPEGRRLSEGRTISNCVYSMAHLFDKDLHEYSLPEEVIDYASEKLAGCLEEMTDLKGHPEFRRTDNMDVCRYCDFKMICGR